LEGAQADLVYLKTLLRRLQLAHEADIECRKSTLKSLSTYVKEHFSNAAYGAYPIEDDSKVAVVVVANKYSPNNYWYGSPSNLWNVANWQTSSNGRWRSVYIFDPSSGALEGTIKVDVHYYEDGNVRLLTSKPVAVSIASGSGTAIVREISAAEKKYQEELNKGFTSLSEGTFKGLRRQLPVTRQKIEWDKVASYRVGQDIGGGSSRRWGIDSISDSRLSIMIDSKP
jgi:hypothetical protein